MYIHHICGVDGLSEELEAINESQEQIISIFFTSDTFQVIIITKIKEEQEPQMKTFQGLMGRMRDEA